MRVSGRTDAHRPGAIDPADYAWVGCFVNHPPVDADGEEIDVENAFHEVPGFEPMTFGEALSEECSPARAYPGELDRCDRCGQRINYAAVYRHDPTGQFVVLGHRCADSVMGFEDRRALRAAKQRDLLAAARKDTREEAERRGGLEEARRLYPGAFAILDGYDGSNRFLADVAGRLAKSGNLSEAQAEKIVESHARDLERQKKRESGEEQPVPGGEAGKGVLVQGVVLKTQERKDPYAGRWGRSYKLAITVRDYRGFVVWGHAPEALHALETPEGGRDVEKGDRVRLVANLDAKKNDPFFGWFKRPRKAEIVAFREPEEAAAEVDKEALVWAAVEDVRRAIREEGIGGVPDDFSARQAVTVLEEIVETGREGAVLEWWRRGRSGPFSRGVERRKAGNRAVGLPVAGAAGGRGDGDGGPAEPARAPGRDLRPTRRGPGNARQVDRPGGGRAHDGRYARWVLGGRRGLAKPARRSSTAS